MKIIIFNAKKLQTKEEMHECFKKAFDFPDCYGKNLDALHDLLSEPHKKTRVFFKNLHVDDSPLNAAYEVFADVAMESSWLAICDESEK